MRTQKQDNHFELGKTLFLQGQFELARNEFLSAVELESNHAESLHFLGLIAHHFGQFKSAIELFERAIAIAPETGEYYVILGNAVEHARRAIAINPDLPAAQ